MKVPSLKLGPNMGPAKYRSGYSLGIFCSTAQGLWECATGSHYPIYASVGGHYGVVGAYRGDDKRVHCELMRHYSTIDSWVGEIYDEEDCIAWLNRAIHFCTTGEKE